MKTTKTPRRSGSRSGSAVLLETYQPDAIDVCVAGSFNNWQPQATPLVPLGNGKWAKELTLPAGSYEYRFVVDGQWVTDPKAEVVAPNPFGSENAVLTVDTRG
jgi:1,4-alpha-glucan branching enzyme